MLFINKYATTDRRLQSLEKSHNTTDKTKRTLKKQRRLVAHRAPI